MHRNTHRLLVGDNMLDRNLENIVERTNVELVRSGDSGGGVAVLLPYPCAR